MFCWLPIERKEKWSKVQSEENNPEEDFPSCYTLYTERNEQPWCFITAESWAGLFESLIRLNEGERLYTVKKPEEQKFCESVITHGSAEDLML